MRIPNAAEFFSFFVVTGQLSGLSDSDSRDSRLRLVGADSDLSLLRAPECSRPYTVRQGETCNSIGALQHAPTFQIICQNDDINRQCTNLSVGQEICLGRVGEDCRDTVVTQWPYDNALSIANRYNIPLDIFEANNYCYYNSKFGNICPLYTQESSVCIARERIGNRPKCEKIFAPL